MQRISEESKVTQVTWEDDGTVDVLPGTPARPEAAEPLFSVMNKAISRRTLLKGAGTATATLVLTPTTMMVADQVMADTAENPEARLTFQTISPGNEVDVVVPPGYRHYTILKWGDPLFPDAPEFDVNQQTGASQAQQFGFNADLVLFYPLPMFVMDDVESNGGSLSDATNTQLGAQYPELKKRYADYALMVVNHEYTSADDMFPDYDPENPTQDQVEVEIEAHGCSIVQLQLNADRQWEFARSSQFNRRITGTTEIEITGPLAGDDLMKTSADPTGTRVMGMFNNCAGGKTPWGTILTCEENFDQYFGNYEQVPAELKRFSDRIAAEDGATDRKWENFDERFDLSTDPTEYHRFGYIVEIDPYDPSFVPKKRTALGRFKHEGAACNVTADGRVAVYSGDDARFEYVYKFISAQQYRRYGRTTNLDVLDNGILYVGRFDAGDVEGDEMGTGVWLPLVWAPGNALDQAGYNSQAEVLLDTRGAADVLGATPMDRPEDIEVSSMTGKVYVCLTNNSRREEPNEANPRVNNQHGHVIEIVEDGNDAGALTFTWNILIKCGDPAQDHDARFGTIEDPVLAGCSPISDPDNCVHDDIGNLWISTDGQFFSGSDGFGQNDGVFATPVEGPDRGLLRQFLSGVPGGEVCGPEFSSDGKTFFCAIQHPNDGEAFEKIWPIGQTDVSKPSLIGVQQQNNLKIGR